MSVRVQHSVSAKCKPEHAWQKFEKAEEWPWWNRVVGQAKWDGPPWQKGSRLLLELSYPKRNSLKASVSESSPPRAIVFQVHGSGMSGTMRFAFTATDSSATTLSVECDFSGWKTALSGGSIQQDFRKAFDEWLDALKAEAEKIAREQFARS